MNSNELQLQVSTRVIITDQSIHLGTKHKSSHGRSVTWKMRSNQLKFMFKLKRATTFPHITDARYHAAFPNGSYRRHNRTLVNPRRILQTKYQLFIRFHIQYSRLVRYELSTSTVLPAQFTVDFLLVSIHLWFCLLQRLKEIDEASCFDFQMLALIHRSLRFERVHYT